MEDTRLPKAASQRGLASVLLMGSRLLIPSLCCTPVCPPHPRRHRLWCSAARCGRQVMGLSAAHSRGSRAARQRWQAGGCNRPADGTVCSPVCRPEGGRAVGSASVRKRVAPAVVRVPSLLSAGARCFAEQGGGL